MMRFGATWLSCRVPLRDGTLREVILGHPTPQSYCHHTAYMGAVVGRFANRIANASFTRDGQTWRLAHDSSSPHNLHGGPDGFHRRCWRLENETETQLRLVLLSSDGDQGYLGDLRVSLTVTLTGPRKILLQYEATLTHACPVSLTHHPYFNLDQTHGTARQHSLQIAAGSYLPVDAELIPIGHLQSVAGTTFDFRVEKTIARDWMQDHQQQLVGGYDHAFLLDKSAVGGAQPAATLSSTDARLRLRIFTTLPAIQFYGGQFLAGVAGRESRPYESSAGVALEPQFLPDSPNHPEWPQPSCWIGPEDTYRHSICYDFEAL